MKNWILHFSLLHNLASKHLMISRPNENKVCSTHFNTISTCNKYSYHLKYCISLWQYIVVYNNKIISILRCFALKLCLSAGSAVFWLCAPTKAWTTNISPIKQTSSWHNQIKAYIAKTGKENEEYIIQCKYILIV